ncbi:hypothetical protein RF11_03716 [Thelohanellus kitauei]|uniref:Uncharacterized protein n=1 Tax=Thelohanellus kitauei TaxID=669202 RepID=A0A0C2IVW5_THEKT|nr:hypothetical protein RF11_03716 [Thelohanellus kitauei]
MTSESANAYFEAAKVNEIEPLDLRSASAKYLEFANCYRQALSERAHDLYQLAIESFLKHKLYKVPFSSLSFVDTIMEKIGEILVINDEFYDKAVEFGVKYGVGPMCTFTGEYMQGVIRDVSEELDTNTKGTPLEQYI